MNNKNDIKEDEMNTCGIIMPIASMHPYKDGHWNDVYSVLCESALSADLKPNLVSFDDDVTVLHKRIIRNIYFNPIIICDISGRNPNVMFELGMRLAFDKPTIIVKDNLTINSFDISSIEYLEYPSDLHYQSILSFKEKLKNKLLETLKRSQEDDNYSTFLRNFGDFKTAKFEEKEVPVSELIIDEIRELSKLVKNTINNTQINSKQLVTESYLKNKSNSTYTFPIKPTKENMELVINELSGNYNLVSMIPDDEDSLKVTFKGFVGSNEALQINQSLSRLFGS